MVSSLLWVAPNSHSSCLLSSYLTFPMSSLENFINTLSSLRKEVDCPSLHKPERSLILNLSLTSVANWEKKSSKHAQHVLLYYLYSTHLVWNQFKPLFCVFADIPSGLPSQRFNLSVAFVLNTASPTELFYPLPVYGVWGEREGWIECMSLS